MRCVGVTEENVAKKTIKCFLEATMETLLIILLVKNKQHEGRIIYVTMMEFVKL